MKRELLISTVFFLVIAMVLIPVNSHAEAINSGVAFQEIGLPDGTLWAVNCNGQQYQSNTSVISITLPPGTYSFDVASISGYTISPQNGNVTAILDPIKITDITFSTIIPEFPNIAVTLFLLSIIVIFATITKVRTMKKKKFFW